MQKIVAAVLTCAALLTACTSAPQHTVSTVPSIPTAKARLITQKAETPFLAFPQAITWEVENRFRLLPDKAVLPGAASPNTPALDEETRFYRDLSLEITEYKAWYKNPEKFGFLREPHFDLIHTDPEAQYPFRNYMTRYSPRTGSYRCAPDRDQSLFNAVCADQSANPNGQDWIEDQSRMVQLSVNAPNDAQCQWTIDGTTSTGPCANHEIKVQLDQTYVVSARVVGEDASQAPPSVKVKVKDVKIVAIGDSFSAGEGIPHSQWRGPFTGNRPAFWLDPRCHRSLLSGPSLAAAYLAKHNPHLSVTLLHYGCSGATTVDGVMGPWGMLSSFEDIRARNHHFGKIAEYQNQAVTSLGSGFNHPDAGLSQIGQARADLTLKDGTYIEPDFVVLSTGGNDLGFAGIIGGLITSFGAPTDLQPDPPADTHRAVTQMDEAMWSEISAQLKVKEPACRAAPNSYDCMKLNALARINSKGLSGDIRDLASQYKALRLALDTLVKDKQRRVLITEYPYFVTRSPTESDKASDVFSIPYDKNENLQVVGCVDRVFGQRNDMVPNFLVWLPWFGFKPGSADKAVHDFQLNLNGAVEAAALDSKANNQWTVVKSHLKDSVGHGYCSNERYYNTLVDAYWYQGRNYGPDRELANIQLLKLGPDHLGPGDRVIWDGDASPPCFRRYQYADEQTQPTDLGCLSNRAEVDAAFRHKLPPRTPQGVVDKLKDFIARDLGTSGPVHPNLFGHCNYAAAIVSQMVITRGDDFDFDPEFLVSIRMGRDGVLHDTDICNSDAWYPQS